MLLVDEKQLSLDDNINDYLEEELQYEETITIRFSESTFFFFF